MKTSIMKTSTIKPGARGTVYDGIVTITVTVARINPKGRIVVQGPSWGAIIATFLPECDAAGVHQEYIPDGPFQREPRQLTLAPLAA